MTHNQTSHHASKAAAVKEFNNIVAKKMAKGYKEEVPGFAKVPDVFIPAVMSETHFDSSLSSAIATGRRIKED